MNISGITWRGEGIDDDEILHELPPSLVRILLETNGFILHHGALHVRGASLTPDWHSLRVALRGPTAFHALYPSVQEKDVPFAQDLVGDQYLLRDGGVFRLSSEDGDIEPLTDSLDEFFRRSNEDIEEFLNVGLRFPLQPGELLLAIPAFVFRESGADASLKPTPAGEVIRFHADLARQIRDVPDGAKIEIKIGD